MSTAIAPQRLEDLVGDEGRFCHIADGWTPPLRPLCGSPPPADTQLHFDRGPRTPGTCTGCGRSKCPDCIAISRVHWGLS